MDTSAFLAIENRRDANHRRALACRDESLEARDKTFSFTDCTSFALMEELGITTVFTVDEHFRQYGAFTVKP